ncbi:FAD-dependent oxidoreductase [Paenibacillus sp. YYML68]|uniref:FAD-dependent oxidoreductase n=1 Tax=Paenibacillus sp. YYML68 TaxID=2909250 RepID=UPI002491B72D|nr:FAD-dependent oxidoreductase [Paenibacillus sp. YYML68]
MSRTVLIIGGGIAGLTCAIALQQLGMNVLVYEREMEPTVAGAGIIIAPNALKALEPYGIDREIRREGMPSDGFQLLTDAGKTISQLSVPSGYGRLYALHRKDLHQMLLSRLKPGTVEWGKIYSHHEQAEGGVRVIFRDGSQAQGELLIAADGIHSALRKQLSPHTAYRYAGYTCWRGIVSTDDLPEISHHFIETWGAGGRFGIVPLPHHQVYWYALVNAKANDSQLASYTAQHLHSLFKDYHDPIPSLLQKTASRDMIHRDIIDIVPMQRFYTDRVVFIGDAAHAITPNMGQGACQAIEDASVLADCLRRHGDYREAYAAYDKRRRKRMEWISKQSWSFGKIAQAEGALFIAARNQLMRAAPKAMYRSQAKKLYDVHV